MVQEDFRNKEMQLCEQLTVYTLSPILRERFQPASDFKTEAKPLPFFSMKGRKTHKGLQDMADVYTPKFQRTASLTTHQVLYLI